MSSLRTYTEACYQKTTSLLYMQQRIYPKELSYKTQKTPTHAKKAALMRTISNKKPVQQNTFTTHQQTDVTEEMQIIPTFIYQPIESLFEDNDIHIS